MRHAVMAATVALAMSASPAFAQAARPQDEAHKQAPKTGMKAGAKTAGTTFVMNAAKDGMAEVEIGKLATEKASNPQVKQFGQRMVDDHGKANEQLKTLAQNKNITLPTGVEPKHNATRDRLSKLSGEAFDHAYMQEMVVDHRKAVNAFRTEAKSGSDPDIKAWAAKTLPTLEEHLKLAQEANKAVGTSGTMPKKEKK